MRHLEARAGKRPLTQQGGRLTKRTFWAANCTHSGTALCSSCLRCSAASFICSCLSFSASIRRSDVAILSASRASSSALRFAYTACTANSMRVDFRRCRVTDVHSSRAAQNTLVCHRMSQNPSQAAQFGPPSTTELPFRAFRTTQHHRSTLQRCEGHACRSAFSCSGS